MKLIFSRKGFDSAAGGVASPILLDGTMLSLPIPSKASSIRYQDITLRGHNLGPLVTQLTRGKKKAHYTAHHDPDLEASARPRAPGWRALFGQADSAQSVLAREGVGVGDLFLFFGWFRCAELVDGAFRFVKGAPDQHVIWGWMQVAGIVSLPTGSAPSWATYHPHVAHGDHLQNNTLYVAAERLTLDGVECGCPGAGVFAQHEARLVLTKPGASRSVWSLPRWFEPQAKRRALGLHDDLTRWTRFDDHVQLQSVARGQEFVLDTSIYPESIAWVRGLLCS